MTNKPSMLNWIHLVICENGIIALYVWDVPNVDLEEYSCFKLNIFLYSVPLVVWVESTHLLRVFMPKYWNCSPMRFSLKMFVHKRARHNLYSHTMCRLISQESDPLVSSSKTDHKLRFIDDFLVNVFPSCSRWASSGPPLASCSRIEYFLHIFWSFTFMSLWNSLFLFLIFGHSFPRGSEFRHLHR